VSNDRSKRGAKPAPQIAISENLASIKFLVPYSAALARNVLPGLKVTGPRFDSSPADEQRRVALMTARGTKGKSKGRGKRIRRARVADADEPAADPVRTGLEPTVLKHEMATVLDDFSYGRLRSIEVSVRPKAGGLLVTSAQLDGASLELVRGGIEKNYALVQMLTKFARVGKPVTFRADIDRRTNSIDVENLTMAY
jgi:hypothetical protein